MKKHFLFELFLMCSAKDSFRISIFQITIPPKLPDLKYRYIGFFSAKIDFYNKKYARVNISLFGFDFTIQIPRK